MKNSERALKQLEVSPENKYFDEFRNPPWILGSNFHLEKKEKKVSLVWDRGFAFLKTFFVILIAVINSAPCGTSFLLVKSTGVG